MRPKLNAQAAIAATQASASRGRAFWISHRIINPANKLIRKRKDLAVAEEATIVNGIGAIACLVRSGIVGSKESSDGHRVTRWTL